MTQTNFNYWLTPPTFANEEPNRLAGLYYAIFWGTIAVAIVSGVLTLIVQPEPWPRLLFTGLWLPVALGSLALLRRGELKVAGRVYAILAWLILTLEAWLAGGVTSAAFSSYIIIIMVIGIMAGLRLALLFAGLSFATGGVLLYVDSNGVLPETPLMTTPVLLWLVLSINFVAAAVLIHLATSSISTALKQTRANEAALLTSNRQLQAARVALQERTGELATAVELLEVQLTERQQILESLVHSQQQLRQLNLELEQRVRERTSELVEMNEALTQEIATRGQAELALQETFALIERAKQEWEVTVDSVPQFIGLLDRQGRLKRANRTVERWNLAPVTRVRGQTIHQLFHPDCTDPACPVENFWRQASQKLNQGQIWQGEVDDKTLGRYLQWQVEPISAPPGDRQQPSETWGVVVVRDITARKQTELELAHYRHDLEELVSERTAQLNQVNQELQQSEAQFRQVITSISDHIYVTEITAAGEHLNHYISPNVEMLTGYPPDRFLADWSFWSEHLVYSADRATAAAQLARLEQGQPGETEYRLTRADGQVIWVRDSGRVEPRNGAIVVYGVINDITARKAAEETILRYSEQLEILQEIEQGILSAQSVEAIVQATMSRIQRLIPCYSATVTILDLATDEALVTASDMESDDGFQAERRIKFGQDGLSGARLNKLRQGAILVLEDAQLGQYHDITEAESIRSVMVVPLIHQTELIGTLNLSATVASVFTPEHQEMAQQVADQLAIAMRQTQLYEQVQRHAVELEQRVTDRTRELSALYEITAVASQSLELSTMLAQALEQVLTALRSDVGLIWLGEPEAEQQFQLVAQQGLAADEVGQVEACLTGSGLLSQVLGQNQPLVLPTLVAAPSLAGASLPAGLQTFVGASIRVAGQRLGVVTIFGRLVKQFNLEDVALLSTVADQMGVAVENTRLREQARQAAVLAERERLARELHDSVTQSLYSLTLFAEGALEQAKNGQLEPVQHNLTRIGEAAQQALKEMRLMVYELRPVDLEQEGLVGALHQRLAAVERRAGITARLIAEDLVELPLAVEQEFYGITQEALNNTLKHSGASLVTVHLRRVDEEVELAIQDNGHGFDVSEVQNKGGLGLRGLRERVNKLHGVLTIRSTPGQGTTIEVRVRV